MLSIVISASCPSVVPDHAASAPASPAAFLRSQVHCMSNATCKLGSYYYTIYPLMRNIVDLRYGMIHIGYQMDILSTD